jgi:membrane associated rhomboid family serine protease
MPTVHAFVAVLQILLRRHPRPWFYHQEPEADGFQFPDLRSVLEYLATEGLVEKAPPEGDSGIGARLTPLGLRVARDPQALARLERGEPVSPDSIGAIVRADSRRAFTPWFTYLFMAISIGVFLYGLSLSLRMPNVRHDSGALSGEDLLDGKWWRMVTSTFYHGGGIHLLMNMFALWSLGSFVERSWGRWRFAVIYLLAAFGGTCTAMAFHPFPVLGASGAVCGMLGAIAVYVVVLSRYLPRSQSSGMWTNLIINMILITVISLMPGVSGLGHLGGGVVGALAALAMIYQRFGGPFGSLAGLLAIPLIAYGSFFMLQQVRSSGTMAWNKVELSHLGKGVDGVLTRTARESSGVDAVYLTEIEPLTEQRASRRNPDEVNTAREKMAQGIEQLRGLAAALRQTVYRTPVVRSILEASERVVQARIAFYEDVVRCLDAGEAWTRADQKSHEELWENISKAIEESSRVRREAQQKFD